MLRIFIPIFFLTVGGLAASGGEFRAAIPEAGSILATLRAGHPRLYGRAEDFARLKEEVAQGGWAGEWERDLVGRADRMLGETPSKYEIPDGLRLLSVSRRVLQRVETLGLVFRMTGKNEYAERAWRELEAAAAFPDWNPRHFLDTAEMTHAFALGYDWLFEVWTPEQRKTIRQAMVEKGLRPAQAVYHGTSRYSAWNKARHNWNQVCNGGIAMGALALADEIPDLAGELLARAGESVQLAMREFAPDGAWAEGPGYWNYATTYNVALLATLETALGTDFGLAEFPGFAETGDFPIYLTGPLGRTFNYADGGDGTIRAPQMFWLARQFNRPAYAAYEARAASPAPLDLLWRRTMESGKDLPLDRYFRGAEVVTLRSAWGDTNAVFVGFKGGNNRANHSHLDLGTFVLDALGVRWALDLGADNYNLPAYFGKDRWTYYRLRAEGHNTLVLRSGTGGMGPDQDPSAKAGIIKFDSSNARAVAVADLGAAYAGAAKEARRGIALLDRNRVLVQDEVRMDEPTDAWWFMHTRADIEVSPDGVTAALRENGRQLNARLWSAAGARFVVLPAEPLPGTPQPGKQHANAGVRKLAVHLTGIKEARIAVLLTPDGAGVASESGELIPLANW